VAVLYTERGTSVRSFRGDPPATGRSYEIVAMEWFEIKESLIYRRWGAIRPLNPGRWDCHLPDPASQSVGQTGATKPSDGCGFL
jgi:hypothetical protein